jgi:hypothetical protein
MNWSCVCGVLWGIGNSDSYKVFLENGFKMSEGSFTSNENDGSFYSHWSLLMKI